MAGGGSEIFFDYQGGGSQKIELLARGAAKISSLEFQYLHSLVILNELSLTSGLQLRSKK